LDYAFGPILHFNNAGVGKTSGIGTIISVKPPASQFSLANYSVPEAMTALNVTVTR
jgi:hypothetical protein